MTSFSASFSLTGCAPLGSEFLEDALRIHAAGSASDALCPSCNTRSGRVHSHYTRSPADLPISDQSVQLCLRLRRFRCINENCARRTFSEPLPTSLPRYARRTTRLALAQCHVGFATGAEAGARLLTLLRMPTSPDTLLRLLHQHPLPEASTPRVLGVDDWAWRRGRAWGTILLDLERRRPVDLLPDRKAETLTRWLQSHPGIEVVARDRSTEYARGITEGAPEAMQVADRWHLLHNFRQVLERFFWDARGRLQDLPGLADLPAPSHLPQRRTKREVAASEEARQCRCERYVEARRFHAEEGFNIAQISRALAMSRVTVRKYLSAESFPEWSPHPARQSILAPYEVYLEERWARGERSASALFRELRARGYSGSTRPLHPWAQERRTEPHPCTPVKYRIDCLRPPKATRAARGKLPAPRRLAWLLMREPDALGPEEEQLLGALRIDLEVSSAHKMAHSYVHMIRERQSEALDPWLAACSASESKGFKTFAAGLRQDYAAVRAALTEPWSSGQAEGQINRLKALKRQMYGRASFNLLRQRVLYAA